MRNKAEQSRKIYNEMAKEYDTSREGQYTIAHRKELLKNIRLQDGETIVDVACGNGSLLYDLSHKAAIQAYGIDISENMIAAAQKHYPQFHFTTSASVPLPFDDSTMDVITVSCAFHHFEDPKAFAKECQRILKNNGRLYIAEPYFSPIIRFLTNNLLFPFSKSGDVKVYSQRELCAFFEQVGLTTTTSYRKGTVLFYSGQKRS